MSGKSLTGELLPRGDESVSGTFIGADEGVGSILDSHSGPRAADELRGRSDAIDLNKIDEAWVLRRLVAEATDFGTRTRQSGRLKALELIGKTMGMFDEAPAENPADVDRQRARELPQAERLARMQKLLAQAGVSMGQPKH